VGNVQVTDLQGSSNLFQNLFLLELLLNLFSVLLLF